MRKQRIEDRAKALVEQGAFSGIEWLIHRGDEPWARGRAGQLDAVAGTPMPEKPLYRIYSMTKPIVSVAALMLMERLKLRLFDPVAAYLPKFAQKQVLDPDGTTRQMRGMMIIEHLLTHRAGLSYGFLIDCPVGQRYTELDIMSGSVSLAEMIDRIAEEPLAFDPGTNWRYSVATDVVARVLEVIEGKPIAAILKELIFDPLGMTDTGFMVPESERHRVMGMFGEGDLNRIMIFAPPPQTLRPADVSKTYPTDNPDFGRGGHGLFSTLDDYMKFVRLLKTGCAPNGDRLLSRKTMQMIARNRIQPEIMPIAIGPLVLAGYGYGLTGRVMLDTGAVYGLTSQGEWGWAGAASTYFWVDPEEDVEGVVMSQYLGSIIPLGDDIRVAAYQALD